MLGAVQLAPEVDVTVLQWALIVMIAAVGLLAIPECDMRLPPSTKHTL